MTTKNVCVMYIPRSAACCKKFLQSRRFGEKGLRNIIQRTPEMLQEEQGKRNKRKGVETVEGERRALAQLLLLFHCSLGGRGLF